MKPFLLSLALVIFVNQVYADVPNTDRIVTTNGVLYLKDSSLPALGVAWRDEYSGIVWGEVVRKTDWTGKFMSQTEAKDYCRSIGAELPSRDDFLIYRRSMGAFVADSSFYANGYTPQLFWFSADPAAAFWTSSVVTHHSDRGYGFNSSTGILYDHFQPNERHLVKCIVRRPAVRHTRNGSSYQRDETNPLLGESWKDSAGVIWGDLMRLDGGQIRTVTWKEAESLCKSVGAELPSDTDLDRLKDSMCSMTTEGSYCEVFGYNGLQYVPEVLPNLSLPIRFWSSKFMSAPRTFDGMYGTNNGAGENDSGIAVRCVMRK